MQKNDIALYRVKEFLFDIINREFGFGYVPEYHMDICDMETCYLKPKKNTFFLAIHKNTKKLIGAAGIRAYDKDFEIFKDVYDPKSTASICRVFVDKNWRRNGIGSSLVSLAEDFCKRRGYAKVYLHTHKTVRGSLNFWLSNGYEIVKDTKNELGTVHMEKILV